MSGTMYNMYANRVVSGEEMVPTVPTGANVRIMPLRQAFDIATPETFPTWSTAAKARWLVLDQGATVSQASKFLNVRYQQVYQTVKKELSKQQEATAG